MFFPRSTTTVCAILFMVIVALGGACSSEHGEVAFEESGRQQLAAGPIAPGAAVGDPCTSDAHCGKAMMCVDQTVCMCRVPLAACSHRCVDVRTDRANCGRCGVRCGAGAKCVDGTCSDSGFGPGIAAASIGSPFQISPYTALDCTGAHEGVPVWYPDGAFGTVLTSFNRIDSSPAQQGNDFATGWTNYTNTNRFVGIHPSLCAVADPWTEYSGNNNIIYSAMVAWRRSGAGGSCNSGDKCTAISGISPANVASNNWNFPGVCITTATQDDGPAIQYDWAGSSLWATSLDLATSSVRLQIFNNCGVDVPGMGGCPLTSNITAGTTNGMSHPHVLVNPSTHHGIVSFIDSASVVNIKFYTATGTLSSSFSPPGFGDLAFFGTNIGCPVGGNQAIAKCTGPAGPDCTPPGGSGCSRLVPRVQMAEKFDGAAFKQYLYLAYDIYCGIFGIDRFKTRVYVYDITNEAAPVLVRTVWSSGTDLFSACGSPGQEFMGTVESARGSPNVGFYYYRHTTTGGVTDPCKTDFRGQISPSNTFASTTTFQFSGGTFPTIVFGGATMGDYVGTTDGMAFGVLYPTWAQPLGSFATCTSCQGPTTSYTLVVRGNTALP